MTPRVARRTSRPSADPTSRNLTFAPAASSADPLRFERRCAVRIPASGGLVATFRDDEGRAGLTRIDLVDSSDGGLGILSPIAIEPGMIVTLRDDRTRQPWSDARAVRCLAHENGGYRVGLELTRRMAA